MGQVGCPVTSVTEVLTAHMQQFQKRTELVEFYREAKAEWVCPRVGLGAFIDGFIKYLQSVLIFILQPKAQNILDRLIGLL